MTLDDIRNEWASVNLDKKAALELWDGQADQGCYMNIPEFSTNTFLQLLEKEKMLQPEFSALDIGCGAGAYSLAISSRVKEVVGTDLSSKMINNGKKLLKNIGIENVSLEIADWAELLLEEKQWEKKFDLAFAHMSPAISDASSLEKLIASSKHFCAVTKPTRRSDSVLDEVKKLVGLIDTRTDFDNDIRHIFDYTWLAGYRPKLMYEPQEWLACRSVKDAFKHYLSRIRQFMRLSGKKENEIYNYLLGLANEQGQVEEVIRSTTVTIYWEV